MLYLDTSALLQLYIREQRSGAVQRQRQLATFAGLKVTELVDP